MTTELVVSFIGLFLGLVAVGTCWLIWVDLRSVWECLADVEDEIDERDRPDYAALLKLYRDDLARIEAEEAAGK